MSKITPIHIRNRIDSSNSTDTPLGIGGNFTGAWTDITQFGLIYVNVVADAESAADGLSIEQSSDGVNADHSDDFMISANVGKNFSINTYARYLRINYTNGASVQTYFKLQVILKSHGKSSTHRITEDITTEDDAELVTSIIKTKANDLDEYKNVELNNPMPVNGDQLYPHDVNITRSNMYTFSGSIIDVIDDRWTPIVDSTASNPKQILFEFERPMQTSIIGITAETGSFSNTLIKYGLSAGPDILLYDESADATAKTLLITPSIPITLTRLILEFHTANTVTLTGVNLAKARQSISRIQGQTEDGELIDIGATIGGNMKVSIQEYGDTPAIDAFDRLRVSNPFTIFDSKQLHDKQPLFWDESIGGSATSTHSSINAAVAMTVTASATDFVIRQTKQRFNYQPGKGQLILQTFHAPQVTGATMRVGAFDGTGTNYLTPNNGIFFEINNTSPSWNIAKNGSTTETYTQSNWNYDPLDGTGPSRLTLDLDGALIAIIDYEWLGVGRVRVGFVIGGIIRYVHYFTHSNIASFTSVYMSTPNLPLRYSIETDGSAIASLDHICSTVISEGGVQETGILSSVNTGTTHLDANTADQKYALLGIRLKTAYSDVTVYPEAMTMISETNDDFKWTLELNPTIAGTFNYNDITNSALQYAQGVTANTVTTAGSLIDSGFAKSNASLDRRINTTLRMGTLIDGTRDTLVLTVTPLSSNADIQGSLTYRELL